MGILSSVGNVVNSATGSVGSALGSAAGTALSGATGSTLGGVVDSVIGGVGDAVEGIADVLGFGTPKVSEDMCANTGVTDAGVISTARLKAALAAGLLTYNTYQAYKIAKKQRDLATKYLEIAEEHRQYFNNLYKPMEINAIGEVRAMPKYNRNKDQFYRGQVLTNLRAQMAGQIDDAIACTGRYCTGQRAALISDKVLEQAAKEAIAGQVAHKYADKEEEAINNRRWERRNQILRQGRDMNNEAVAYADLAMGIFGNLGKKASQAAEGAAYFLGSSGQRYETQYPERRGPMLIPTYEFRGEG